MADTIKGLTVKIGADTSFIKKNKKFLDYNKNGGKNGRNN